MSLATTVIADFEKEAGVTRTLLEAVPEDKLDWKPHDKSMPLQQLAGHIAESPAWIPTMMEDVADMADTGDWKPFFPTNRNELLEKHDQAVALFRSTLEGRDDDFLRQTWSMKAGDKVLMEDLRHAAVRMMAINHVVHHRGQLSVYLRLLGVPLPPIYGPTADNPDMF